MLERLEWKKITKDGLMGLEDLTEGEKLLITKIVNDFSRRAIVYYPGHTISNNNLFSDGYKDCNGIIIINSKGATLSHYHQQIHSEKYLGTIIPHFTQTGNDSFAILVGGNREHFENNKKILESSKIPVLGGFCDNWGQGPWTYDKSILVVPKTQEVFLYLD